MRSNRVCRVISLLVVLGFSMLSVSGCGEKQGENKTPAAKESAKKVEALKAAAEKGSEKAEKKEIAKPSDAPITEERTFYDFETANLDGWEIPSWAEDKSDHIAKKLSLSTDVASHGKGSMKVDVDFTGGRWTAALVEIQQYLDISQYRVIMADVYVPEDTKPGLKAKIILTIGDSWKWVEMSRSMPLIPGEWITIKAIIEPGSYDWKRVVPDKTFGQDVRKIAIRVESNFKPKYTGSLYVDNIRVGK